MKPVVAVALSGGVDSLVAAYLLKEKGVHVIGMHFITGFEAGSNHPKEMPLKREDIAQLKSLKTAAEEKLDPLSKQLDIPLVIIDLQKEFQKCVVHNFIHGYRSGKTPNPCLVCNPSIKFGYLLEHAQKQGAEKLATGHYAVIRKDSENVYHLFKGSDPAKDQSYFLGFMRQDQLARACFPLGNLTKAEVRQLAFENNLHPLTQRESQDVCFIKNSTYGEFLTRFFSSRPGPIEDTAGHIIGEHKGLHLFTIGQRRGINCPASEPYYVVKIDMEKNRLIVGFKHELYRKDCRVEGINWIRGMPQAPVAVNTRVRYRHTAAESIVVPIDNETANVHFKIPQEAVTPGQGAVFYLNHEVLGAGWISKKNP